MPGDPSPLSMSDWVAADGPPLRGRTVGEALRDAAGEAPDVTALVEGAADPAARRRWTYSELLADAERAAAALLERFSPAEKIAIWANYPDGMVMPMFVVRGGSVAGQGGALAA